MTNKTYRKPDYNITSAGGTLKKGVGSPSVPKRKSGPEQQRRMEPGYPPKSIRKKWDKTIEWERWKNDRKKQSDKHSKPLGGIKKIGPKPGTMDYFLQETTKPGYKKEKMAEGGQISRQGSANYKSDRRPSQQKVRKARAGGGLIKGKPKLAKRGWK